MPIQRISNAPLESSIPDSSSLQSPKEASCQTSSTLSSMKVSESKSTFQSLLNNVIEKVKSFWDWLCGVFCFSSKSTSSTKTGTTVKTLNTSDVVQMLNDFKTFCLKDDTSKMEKTVLCIRIYTVDGQVNSRQETSVSADALQSYVSKYLEYVKNNSITKLDLGFCAATLDGKRMHIVSNIPDPNDPSVHLSKYPLPIQQQSDYEQLMPKGCLPWREFQNQITL